MSGQTETSTQGGPSSPIHISIAEPTESRPHSPFNLYHQTVDEEKKVMECQKKAGLRRFMQKQVDRIKAKLTDLEESLDEKKEARALSSASKRSSLARLTSRSSSTDHLREQQKSHQHKPPHNASTSSHSAHDDDNHPNHSISSHHEHHLAHIESSTIVQIFSHNALAAVKSSSRPRPAVPIVVASRSHPLPSIPSYPSSPSPASSSPLPTTTHTTTTTTTTTTSMTSRSTSMNQAGSGSGYLAFSPEAPESSRTPTATATAATDPSRLKVGGGGLIRTGPAGKRPGLVRVQTKTYRRTRWSDGDQDFEEIVRGDGDGRKKVALVWGRGVDEIIPTTMGG